jgi:hypothetical protein
MSGNGTIITDPVAAHIEVSKQYSELFQEWQRLCYDLDWYRHGLTYISEMPNEAGPVATKILQKRPYRGQT